MTKNKSLDKPMALDKLTKPEACVPTYLHLILLAGLANIDG
jgi:hypothetical protein